MPPENPSHEEGRTQKRKSVEEHLASHPEFQSEHEVGDYAFREVILGRLADQFLTEMESAGIAQETADDFVLQADAMEDRSLLASMMALPADIRPKIFQDFAKQNLTGSAMLHELQGRVEREQSRNELGGKPLLGFHVTKSRIRQKPIKHARPGEPQQSWSVMGTETSDWSETPQAYAARDYHALYREKIGHFLYVVRDREGFKFDPSREWSRANSFGIIGEFDLQDVDNEVESAAKRVA